MPFTSSPEDAGDHNINEALDVAIIIFSAIAVYNGLELAIYLPSTFHRYRSLYFWSMMTSALLGVIPASIGGVLQYFGRKPLWVSMLLQNLGFILMVPNQSVVLYSRLHLISPHKIILQILRWLILFCVVLICLPTITLNVGASYLPHSPWVRAYFIMERFQITWFTIQECFISGVYIYYTTQLIRLVPSDDKRRHKILLQLLVINVVVILMDLVLVILQYLDYYYTHVIFKATVYSVKLKLEFAVLGMLVAMVHRHDSDEFWLTEQSPTHLS
ncbi:hypothetical protein ASPSYDRAFT_42240 [Aspergillus sydowii CBS 593.65]|uniref:DUF7703 domain-containing protein n=1 Tax=Aspergillus sydowii CBS 593.65 TaxID=1036612 RepID=A0A1L9TM39_9EURO|nr:uncharacterized protein ASPSYDRAFT_42240 [Aspergillus sydowii CBS 593.65]OJJ60500.1 hypothetical protein ASPSYDRAFT_42240 [Aspergillus sydowii CBS 593.65]